MSNKNEPFPHQMPPSIDECILRFEDDLIVSVEEQNPIDRVFILGAGFSRAFGFTTSANIVKGVMDYIGQNRPNGWFSRNFEFVERFLNWQFPDWRESTPNLIDFVEHFFPEECRCETTFMHPLDLHTKRWSWEEGNCPFVDPGSSYETAMLSFEALLCVYLFAGLSLDKVMIRSAKEFIEKLTEKDVILTFNWDVIPEALLTQTGKPFSRYEWRRDYIKLVKLHGSIDLLGSPNEKMYRHDRDNPKALECITPLLSTNEKLRKSSCER